MHAHSYLAAFAKCQNILESQTTTAGYGCEFQFKKKGEKKTSPIMFPSPTPIAHLKPPSQTL